MTNERKGHAMSNWKYTFLKARLVTQKKKKKKKKKKNALAELARET